MENATEKWIQSYHPLHWRVGGRDMQVLSFGHMTLMERMQCFPHISASDITNCVMICERKYKDAEDYVYRLSKYEHEIVELTRDTIKNYRAWSKSLSNYFNANMGSLVTYEPNDERDPRTKHQKAAGSPWLLCMRVRLLSELGYNVDTINDAPFGRCLTDIQALLELRGYTKVVGDKDASAFNRLDAELEKLNSNGK